jgi:hypothetical protein
MALTTQSLRTENFPLERSPCQKDVAFARLKNAACLQVTRILICNTKNQPIISP